MRYYTPKNKRSIAPKRKSKYSKRHYEKLNVSERTTGSTRNKNFFALPRVVAIAALAIVLIIASVILIPTNAKAQYATGYEVLLCGKSIGIVDDPDGIDTFLEDIRTQFSDAYEMNVTDQLEMKYTKVAAEAKYICPVDVFTNMIADYIEVKVLATIIYVNDWPAAVVHTKEDAEWVLYQATAPYKVTSDGSIYNDISFVEDVRIEEGAADYKNIIDKETALHNLTIGPGVELKYHQVVTGDALSRIARKEGIKVSDIMIANPSLSDSDTIYPGDKLNIGVLKNSLSIKYTETIDRVQDVPCPIEVQEDDTKYTTYSEVVVEGKDGSSQVKAEITYINGIEVDYNLLESDPITMPETRIVKKGTIPVPKELTLATEGRMPFPLKEGSYKRISEYFGEREAPIEGASTFHKGLDFAAVKGTPIYASADGTVKFAGTASGYGQYIRLTHDGGVETRYGHCSQILVSKGDKVKKGQIIGLVGSTGRSSGSHLHWEIRIDGVAVDPLGGK